MARFACAMLVESSSMYEVVSGAVMCEIVVIVLSTEGVFCVFVFFERTGGSEVMLACAGLRMDKDEMGGIVVAGRPALTCEASWRRASSLVRMSGISTIVGVSSTAQ